MTAGRYESERELKDAGTNRGIGLKSYSPFDGMLVDPICTRLARSLI